MKIVIFDTDHTSMVRGRRSLFPSKTGDKMMAGKLLKF